ncbi:hypothetical protein GQ53DRAFT_129827 [Thozetella sp. PMI_491]|nr:hypothetical protein GQ53DRAFT_129827 [Thozetella sp. PMI_491]
MQGLLYQVLEANPSLIPTLLPKMWRELYNSEFDEKFNLEPPTVNEIRDAFSRLAKHESGGLYCFFIDGLDEYHGDYTDGTSLIEGLVVGGNIKVLVSSRPIDACVHAFSSRPKLQVQDLTKGDIQLYITDTIGSHPYMEALVADDREAADRVLKNLTEKASGVFLWVVLACRSLLEGFMAGDYVQDLLLRVDELPRELEDLFRHMLGKVPLRYRRTASKILRVCYENQVLGIEAQVLTMPLALMSEQDLDIQRLPEFRPFTKAQKILKCSNLEARLRSRCCGLVEVHLANSKAIPPGCFCREQDLLRGSLTTRYRELTRPPAHDSLVDSTVYFLHRTVFDFLSTPDVWELDCLSLEDENFDPSAVLACMAATRLYHGTRPHSYVELIRQSMEYSFANSRLKGPSVDHVCSWLGSALLATAEAARGAGETSQISAAPYFKRILHIRRPEIITIALAVEGNFTGFVERPEVLARLRDPAVRHTNPPLLCLTTVQPNLSKLQISRDRPSLRMLSLLFSLGCDPNESFSRHGIATTPWEVAWGSGDLRPEHHKSASLGAIKLLAELTAAFLRAGAIVPPFQSTSGPTSFRLPTHTNIMSAVEYWRTCLVPTSLTLESHALVERCEEIIQMIQAQNKSILEFGSECIIERDMPPEQENTGDEEVGTTGSGPREINFDIDAPSPPGNVSPRGNASAVGHDFWFDSSDEEESTSDSSDDSSSEDDIFVYNDPILDSPFNPRRVRASK